MSKQKAAEYISGLFTKTYGTPQDILKSFRPALRRIVTSLEKESLGTEDNETKLVQLAVEIRGRMGDISIDIIRSRVTDELMLRFYELDNGLMTTGKNRHFKEVIADLMKALISMVYAEKKRALKPVTKRVKTISNGFATSG